ncbi:MAG TPA: NAD(P)H-dependent oxidoreductase subunit E [Gammaproteobacteria bacterium]|nr:NAD(P)H-dependent oxidoreductase subunit E [Gammaproteobacteria bacterium]
MTDEAKQEQEIRRLCEEHAHVTGALLPVLHAIQDRYGCVSRSAQATVAHALNISRAEVHGAVSFYADFREQPRGGRVLKVCRAEACQSMGGRVLWQAASELAGPNLEVEAVYCLGNCACAPSLQLDGRTFGRVDAARIDDLVAADGEVTP